MKITQTSMREIAVRLNRIKVLKHPEYKYEINQAV